MFSHTNHVTANFRKTINFLKYFIFLEINFLVTVIPRATFKKSWLRRGELTLYACDETKRCESKTKASGEEVYISACGYLIEVEILDGGRNIA